MHLASYVPMRLNNDIFMSDRGKDRSKEQSFRVNGATVNALEKFGAEVSGLHWSLSVVGCLQLMRCII